MSEESNSLKYHTLFSSQSATREWLFWFFTLGATLGVLAYSLFVGDGFFLGYSTAMIIYAIIGVFAVITMLKSFFDSIYLSRETRLASKQVAELAVQNDIQKFLSNSSSSIFKSHIESLYLVFKENDEISQDTLVSILHEKLLARNRISELFASILITLGLIGTIMGLIIMITDLQQTIRDVDIEDTQLLIKSLMGDDGPLGGFLVFIPVYEFLRARTLTSPVSDAPPPIVQPQPEPVTQPEEPVIVQPAPTVEGPEVVVPTPEPGQEPVASPSAPVTNSPPEGPTIITSPNPVTPKPEQPIPDGPAGVLDGLDPGNILDD